MKLTANSKGRMIFNLGAKSCTTTGNGVFDTLFNGGNKNTKKTIKDLENQGLDGDIELFVNNSISMEIDVDEFKELSVFCKQDLELEKESARFIYQGIKKFLDDIIEGIKNRGKEIVDVIGNLNKYYLIKKDEVNTLDKDLAKKASEREKEETK